MKLNTNVYLSFYSSVVALIKRCTEKVYLFILLTNVINANVTSFVILSHLNYWTNFKSSLTIQMTYYLSIIKIMRKTKISIQISIKIPIVKQCAEHPALRVPEVGAEDRDYQCTVHPVLKVKQR